MLSLVAPMWLLGLALLPVIRWLHRGGRHRSTLSVSRLALWRGSAESPPAAGERRPPDPAWRRRALLTALLFVALAEPQWPHSRPAITLWVDDSLSMLTREGQATRLADGLAQARSLLAEVEHAEVEMRTLADPWRNLGAPTDATLAIMIAGAARRAPSAPPAALLRRDSLHWLVTDGAHVELSEWPGGLRPDRVIPVGRVARNVGLERLSARRSLNDAQKLDLLLKLTNGGAGVETREVVIATDAGELSRSTHRLEPGASALVNAPIPASTRVHATLQPADALPEDDDIVLDLAPLRPRRVAADPACLVALVAAVRTHPALALVTDNATDVDVVLDCGSRGAAGTVAAIRVLEHRVASRLTGSVQWSTSVAQSRRIALDALPLQATTSLASRPTDAVLLAVGGQPVIVSRAGAPKLIETSLDFESLAGSRGPQVPLLVNMMFEQLLGVRLLDDTVVTDRGAAAPRVVPSVRAGSMTGARVPVESRLRHDGVRPVLVVALLALLWEIVALGRQCIRLSRPAEAQPQ